MHLPPVGVLAAQRQSVPAESASLAASGPPPAALGSPREGPAPPVLSKVTDLQIPLQVEADTSGEPCSSSPAPPAPQPVPPAPVVTDPGLVELPLTADGTRANDAYRKLQLLLRTPTHTRCVLVDHMVKEHHDPRMPAADLASLVALGDFTFAALALAPRRAFVCRTWV